MTLRWVARWIAGVLGAAACVPLVYDAAHNYYGWRTTLNDPSARDAYLTFLEVDVVLLVLVAIATAVGFWLTGRRPRGQSPPRGA